MTTSNPLHEKQPCPRCQRMHAASAYWDKVLGSPQGTKALEKPTLGCPCGAQLRVVAHLNTKNDSPGWEWDVAALE